MKKSVPFIVFLIVLLLWINGWFLYESRLFTTGGEKARQAVQSLSIGRLKEANEKLKGITLYTFTIFSDTGFYYKYLPPALATILGDSVLLVNDSTEVKRYIEIIQKWPQPIRDLSINRLGLYVESKLGKRTYSQRGFNVIFNDTKVNQHHNHPNNRKEYQQIFLIENAIRSIIATGMSSFISIGFLIMLAIFIKLVVFANKNKVKEPFAGVILTSRQIWVALGFYSLWLLIVWVIVLIWQNRLLQQMSSLSGFVNIKFPTAFLIAFSITGLIIILLPILFFIRSSILSMTSEENTSVLKLDIYWFNVIEQYKYLLWRLWPVWVGFMVYSIFLVRII